MTRHCDCEKTAVHGTERGSGAVTVHYEDESGYELPFSGEELAREVIAAALDEVGCPYEADVSLLLTGPAEIREMNRNMRGIDRETDVLSFPMQDFPAPGDFSFLEEEGMESEYFHPESGELLLGDIVISVPRAVEQAREYGHSLRREFAFLVAHSVLHLTGYDHMEPEEAAQMEALQEKILQGLGITRE